MNFHLSCPFACCKITAQNTHTILVIFRVKSSFVLHSITVRSCATLPGGTRSSLLGSLAPWQLWYSEFSLKSVCTEWMGMGKVARHDKLTNGEQNQGLVSGSGTAQPTMLPLASALWACAPRFGADLLTVGARAILLKIWESVQSLNILLF